MAVTWNFRWWVSARRCRRSASQLHLAVGSFRLSRNPVDLHAAAVGSVAPVAASGRL